MAMTEGKKWSRARLLLTTSHPWWARAVMKLIPLPVEGLGTVGISKNWMYYYDPKVMIEQSDELNASDMAHEILHMMLATPERGAGLNHYLMNIAGDIVIYQYLQDMKLAVKPTDASPEMYKVPKLLTHEAYYDLLLKQKKKRKGDGGFRAGQCGSGACNSAPLSKEVSEQIAKIGRDPTEIAAIKKQFAADLKAAEAKKQGSVPAGLAVWADAELAPSVVPWRTKFARSLRAQTQTASLGGQAKRFDARNRNQMALGDGHRKPVLSVERKTKPRVEIVFDTSGSMVGTDLVKCMSEAAGVLRAVRADVSWVAIDAAIQHRGTARDIASVMNTLKTKGGGGGTDFTEYFTALQTAPKRTRPSVVVFFTDGYAGGVSAPPASVQLIWCITPNGQELPHGTVIRMEDAQG